MGRLAAIPQRALVWPPRCLRRGRSLFHLYGLELRPDGYRPVVRSRLSSGSKQALTRSHGQRVNLFSRSLGSATARVPHHL